jgi:ADP-heptose:LPS heptosyltransferase
MMLKSAIPNWWIYRSSVRQQRPPGAFHRQIGIYKVDRLGDFVLALGAIAVLLEAFGPRNCVLIVSPFAVELARREFPFVDIQAIPMGDSRLWLTRRALRSVAGLDLFRFGVGTLICLRHFRSLRDEVLLASIPAETVWAAENSWLAGNPGELAHSRWAPDRLIRVPRNTSLEQCYELRWHRELLSGVLGTKILESDVVPKLVCEPDSTKVCSIGVVPFASARFRDLLEGAVCEAACLATARGYRLHLLAPPRDEERYFALGARLAQLGFACVEVLVCHTLAELLRALASSEVLLAAETGPAHLATAMDKPVVGVIGGGHFGWFAPWIRSGRQQWVAERLDCFGCDWRCKYNEPRCIEGIPIRKIGDALKCALNNGDRYLQPRL